MTLLLAEWRKLFRLTALWGFFALCLAFNGLLLWEKEDLCQPFREAGAIARELGQRVDGSFLAGMESLPRTEYGDTVLALAVVCFGGVGLTAVLAQAGLWPAYFISLVHPSCVWLGISGWFTELGLSGAVPWQETVSTGLDLLAFGLGTALALRLFRRKDIVT